MLTITRSKRTARKEAGAIFSLFAIIDLAHAAGVIDYGPARSHEYVRVLASSRRVSRQRRKEERERKREREGEKERERERQRERLSGSGAKVPTKTNLPVIESRRTLIEFVVRGAFRSINAPLAAV